MVNEKFWKISTLVLVLVLLFIVVNDRSGSAATPEGKAVTDIKEEVKANDDAVKIVIYSDFECPYCGRFKSGALEGIKSQYGDNVELEFKHYPLGFHANAQKAAEASECARDQGKFWEYHDKLFDNQKALGISDLKKYAGDLGLDTAKFNSCLDGGEKADLVKSDMQEASSLGVTGTPTSFVNGEKVLGAQPFEAFKEVIDRKIAGDETVTPPAAQAAPEPPVPSVPKSDRPRVELFVMSHCPYGTQIEKGIIPVVEKLGDKIDFQLKFCDYAMHGKVELDEQLKQYCIQKDSPDKLLPYLKCFLEKGDGAGCLGSVGLDLSALSTCVGSADSEYGVTAGFNDQSTWRGGRFPEFKVFGTENTKYGVRGSPTLVINGQQAQSGRDSSSLLRTICAGFNSAPSECQSQLSAASPSPGFGSAAGGSAAAGGCGA